MALTDNPRLQIIRPSSVPMARLDNLASSNKSFAIRDAKSPAPAENLLAETSMFRNKRNQWGVGGAYVTDTRPPSQDFGTENLHQLIEVNNRNAARPVNRGHYTQACVLIGRSCNKTLPNEICKTISLGKP